MPGTLTRHLKSHDLAVFAASENASGPARYAPADLFLLDIQALWVRTNGAPVFVPPKANTRLLCGTPFGLVPFADR